MASLEDNLNQLLSDPNAMEQIFSLAGKLGMSSEPSGEPEAEEQPLSEREPEAAELSQPLFGAEGFGGLGKLLAISLPAPGTPGKAGPCPSLGRLIQSCPTGLPTLEGGRAACITPISPAVSPMKQSRRTTILRDFTTYLKKKAVPFPGC